MDPMIVTKEETVPATTSLQGYDPSTFIVEEYSEEVRESQNQNDLNIAQEVFIDQDHVTYEVRTIEEVIGLDVHDSDKNEDETVDNDALRDTSIVFYSEGESSSRVGKAAMKKRRGRPPKFQVSEVGADGKKWYSCTVCDEKHEDRMELMQHMRQHNAERPFHCRECGKAFKQAAHLKVHVRQHTGEKPFECTICGKGFRQKAIVDQHMRTHTQLRPYACTYQGCDKSFAQKTSLDNHTKSHQTGRLSEAFKRQQEDQKRKSLLAQEALKSRTMKPKLVQVMSDGKKKPVHRVIGGAMPVGQEKIKTTVVKMTQSQFEQYLQTRAASATSQESQKELSNKQKAATGPFLAYVNLCKPLLQAERPELSLLEVLKELASRWNGMSKPEKQKFAIIAKESDDSKASPAPGLVDDLPVQEEAPEDDAMRSIEGAVFEIGDSNLYTVEKPDDNFFEINKIQDQSLNQNVFGKRLVLLSKGDEQKLSGVEEENLQSVTGFGSEQILEETGVLHFTDDSTEETNTVIFDNGPDGTVVYENGSELEIGNSTIFFMPNIVGEEQLEEVM